MRNKTFHSSAANRHLGAIVIFVPLAVICIGIFCSDGILELLSFLTGYYLPDLKEQIQEIENNPSINNIIILVFDIILYLIVLFIEAIAIACIISPGIELNNKGIRTETCFIPYTDINYIKINKDHTILKINYNNELMNNLECEIYPKLEGNISTKKLLKNFPKEIPIVCEEDKE